VLLHTVHTGMNIPDVVQSVPAHVGKFWFDRWHSVSDYHDRDRIVEDVNADYGENVGFDYPPSLAAWICGIKPSYLEPIYPEFESDLPSWSGLKSPYKLLITESGGWQMRHGRKKLWQLDSPMTAAIDAWHALEMKAIAELRRSDKVWNHA
jgi:hypothetical protein